MAKFLSIERLDLPNGNSFKARFGLKDKDPECLTRRFLSPLHCQME